MKTIYAFALFLIFYCFLNSLNAQECEKGFKEIKKQKLDKAYEVFTKIVEKKPEDAGSYYGFAILYIDPNFKSFDPEKAYVNIKKSKTYYNNMQIDKEKNKLNKINITENAIDSLIIIIESKLLDNVSNQKTISAFTEYLEKYPNAHNIKDCIIRQNFFAFELAKQTNTIESYNEFIDKYSTASQIDSAILFRNERAYELAKNTNTLKSYQEFIDKFPMAKQKDEAILLRNAKAYEEAKTLNTINALDAFIKTYPDASNNKDAIILRNQLAFVDAQAKNTIEAYNDFIAKYPNSNEIKRATEKRNELAFKKSESINTLESYQEFIDKYSDSPLLATAIHRRDSLVLLIESTFTDPRDGKVYKTIRIGNQIWMAENLNYDAGNMFECYDKKSSNCSKYGRLYNWENVKKVVPKGWHLPSKEEFETLLKNLGGEGTSSYKQIIPGGTSGFNALFGGYHFYAGGFDRLGSSAYFWSSTEVDNSTDYAWICDINGDDKKVNMKNDEKYNSFSVRLIKDSDTKDKVIIEDKFGSFADPRDGKTYKTIRIGNQVWMAENLNYDAGEGSWCYDNSSSNSNKYGKLYDWASAKTVAPPGWHLPSKVEFETLLRNMGGEGANSYKHIILGGPSGFNALFGGCRDDNGNFYSVGSSASFWSSSEDGVSIAWLLDVGSGGLRADMCGGSKGYGFSVRYVKDTVNKETGTIHNEYNNDKNSDKFGSFTDSRDNKTYKTVKIGNQVWMAENLNYDAGSGSWCYDNNSSNCSKYGRLYNWETAKRIAPHGWHLPSKAEWETLLRNCGGEGSNAYKQMIPDGSSGFSALVTGYRGGNGSFFSVGNDGKFWSSSELNKGDAWGCGVYGYIEKANLEGNTSKTHGLSIRCVKNN